MTSFKFLVTCALLLPGMLCTISCYAGKGPSDVSFIASTPGDALIKSILTIPAATKVDFIRWDLTLHTAKSAKQNTFLLSVAFGESQPNTLGFKGNGEKLSFSGTYTLSKSKQLNEQVYYLKSPQLRGGIALIKLNENLLHLLTPQYRLMIGNGGWSYTLNRKGPLVKHAVLPAPPPSENFIDDTSLEIVFDGRTPCRDFAKENKLNMVPDCLKIKWKLSLYRDPKTLLPSRYTIKATISRKNDIEGTWAVIKGTPSNPGAVIYQLYSANDEKSFSLLAGDANVLFFLDKNSDLYTGNGDFSFTLNKRKLTTIDDQGLTIKEAEQILGEPANMLEQTEETNEEMTASKRAFAAKDIEPETHKHGNVYFSHEEYKTENEAQKLIYTFIQSNQDQQGFELLKDYGDVAFLQTDKNNFITFVAVKANKLIRLKVNKVTSRTSLREFKKIAKNILIRV